MSLPKLRFPEFSGEWVPKKISSFLQAVGDPVTVVPHKHYREIGVRSHGKGVFHKEPVSGLTLGDKRVFYVVPNTLVFNIVFAWEQAVAVLADEEAGFIASHRFPMYSAKNDEAHLPFVREFFLRPQGKALLGMASPGGAGRNKTLGKQAFLELTAVIPHKDEQEKIATFLGGIGDCLKGLQRKHELLRKFKAGLMQKLFTQQIRVRDDNGCLFPDWETKRLGDVAKRVTQKNSKLQFMRVLTNSAVCGIIDQGDYFDKDIANSDNLGGYYVVQKGDFVYNPRISVSAPVGPIKRNDLGTGVMSPLYTVFRFDVDNTCFMKQYFSSSVWHPYMKSVANYGARHDRMSIAVSAFMDLPLPWPSPGEQRKIADVLSALDDRLAGQALQIERLRKFKVNLLDHMFA